METLHQSILRFIDEMRKMSPAAGEADREFIRMFQYVQCYARSAEGADRALEASATATAFFRVGCYWQQLSERQKLGILKRCPCLRHMATRDN